MATATSPRGAQSEIAPSDWRAQPWKNGRGVTHEILRWPHDAVGPNYDVRVSIATDSEDGPFSTFEGYRRWAVLAGDNPIVLNGVVLARRGDILAVDGSTQIHAHLPIGPTRVLTVLSRVPVEVGVSGGGSGDDASLAAPVDFVFAVAATAASGGGENGEGVTSEGALRVDHAVEFASPRPVTAPGALWIRRLRSNAVAPAAEERFQ